MIRYWLAGAAAFAILSGIGPPQTAGAADAAFHCDASDKVDGTNTAYAQKKIKAAGYSQVTQLQKGCDSYWHGMAVKDGVATHVALTPDGMVRPEGD
ncbi:MAG TPA: hypothetical protein VNT30_14320 [Stellaceae bacterium]|nr:hypothetical protein [Stellaceae bacterium]